MRRLIRYLMVALVAFALGVASASAWLRFRTDGEPCVNLHTRDRYVTVLDKTTGRQFRVRNCAPR